MLCPLILVEVAGLQTEGPHRFYWFDFKKEIFGMKSVTSV